jgi:RHS repeat-associated protein
LPGQQLDEISGAGRLRTRPIWGGFLATFRNSLKLAFPLVKRSDGKLLLFTEIGNRKNSNGSGLFVAFYHSSKRPDPFDVLHGNGYQTDTNNRLISDGTYSYAYDNEGNMILRTAADGSTRSFEFDHRNRLVAVSDKDASGTQVQLVEFAYDALGRRITKSVTDAAGSTHSTSFVYDGPDVVLDFVDDNLVTRYLHGPAIDQVLAQESNGQVLWHLADHLGTTHDLVDSTGQVVQHFQFDSFGQLLSVESPLTRYLFTGREYESGLEIYFYRARYYDVAIGEFVSEDPIGFSGLDANLTRYVGNAPHSARDPSGLTEEQGHATKSVREQAEEKFNKKSTSKLFDEIAKQCGRVAEQSRGLYKGVKKDSRGFKNSLSSQKA